MLVIKININLKSKKKSIQLNINKKFVLEQNQNLRQNLNKN